MGGGDCGLFAGSGAGDRASPVLPPSSEAERAEIAPRGLVEGADDYRRPRLAERR
jgi:hypothetical protein